MPRKAHFVLYTAVKFPDLPEQREVFFHLGERQDKVLCRRKKVDNPPVIENDPALPMPAFRDQEHERTGRRNAPDWWQLLCRPLKVIGQLENFPFVVLTVLSALSLASRLWLLRR
ncbi:MAG TPA: hypothetical protein VGD78_06090 [Chthoniobacterales bacterium]